MIELDEEKISNFNYTLILLRCKFPLIPPTGIPFCNLLPYGPHLCTDGWMDGWIDMYIVDR